jgi:glycosyltransferase involved in cell wall biosynthesis
VFLPGYLSEPQLLLEETDLLVLPSHSEGLPNVALEALAMEVPVLATRVGGTPEIISDGETGRLVEPGSPEALASAIVEFLRDQRSWKEMAVRGRQVVESEFSFDARTRKLEAIYNAVSSGLPS